MLSLGAIWKAVKCGDQLVTAAGVVSLVTYIQITISTGLINTEPRQFQHVISVLVEDSLTTAGRDDGRASVPMVAINGIVTRNMTVPNGHTPKHAFQAFSLPADRDNTTFSAFPATVGVASVDVQCEIPTISDPTNPFAPDALFLQFSSTFCASRRLIAQIQAQNAKKVPEGRGFLGLRRAGRLPK